MGGVFACPECGYELKLEGLSPGRQTRCGWCEALVEVPFIPRAEAVTKRRRFAKRRPPWLFLAWGSIAALTLVIAAAGSAHFIRNRDRAGKEKALSELVASAKAAEASNRLGDAVAATEAALVTARKLDPEGSDRIENLVRSRDQLARREIEARLAELERGDPSQAVGECLTLLARIEKQLSLSPLEDSVRSALDRASTKSIESELARASQALESGRPDETMRLCERISKTADHVSAARRRTDLERITAIVTKVAAQYGIVVKPVRGQFGLGTSAAYAASLQPLLTDVFKAHGYVPCSASSSWCAVWDRSAPYQLQIDVTEDLSEKYMQSRNRVSHITARLVLMRGGAILWERIARGRTQVPLPNLPAYQGARIAAGDRQSTEFERLLYENAYEALFDQMGKMLRTVPDCSKPPPITPVSPKASFFSPAAPRTPSAAFDQPYFNSSIALSCFHASASAAASRRA